METSDHIQEGASDNEANTGTHTQLSEDDPKPEFTKEQKEADDPKPAFTKEQREACATIDTLDSIFRI